MALGADSDKFLDSWGPGYLRDQSRGAAWEITGPGITPERASPTSISLPKDSSVTESADAYTNEIARIVDSPDVMQVTASGHGRISDSAGHDLLLQGGGGTFCLKKDGCKCPNADVSEPPPLQLSGSVALGLTGGASGSTATLDGQSLEDYCNKGPLAGTWQGTWVNDNGLADGGFKMTLTQKGKTAPFSGPIQVSGKTCVRNGNVQGTLSSTKVTFGVVGAERPIDFTGTLSGKTSMSGSWSSIACGPPYGPATGGPYPVTGTWQAKKLK